MDVQTVMTLISTVGFPICVCLLCFWYIYKMTEQHKMEIEKLSEALNNNTLALQKLTEKMVSAKEQILGDLSHEDDGS